jgi:hypothetical protein
MTPEPPVWRVARDPEAVRNAAVIRPVCGRVDLDDRWTDADNELAKVVAEIGEGSVPLGECGCGKGGYTDANQQYRSWYAASVGIFYLAPEPSGSWSGGSLKTSAPLG